MKACDISAEIWSDKDEFRHSSLCYLWGPRFSRGSRSYLDCESARKKKTLLDYRHPMGTRTEGQHRFYDTWKSSLECCSWRRLQGFVVRSLGKGSRSKRPAGICGVSRKVVRRVIRSGATAVPVANCDDRAARVCRLSGGTIELRE